MLLLRGSKLKHDLTIREEVIFVSEQELDEIVLFRVSFFVRMLSDQAGSSWNPRLTVSGCFVGEMRF
jgi:hypothetical protein